MLIFSVRWTVTIPELKISSCLLLRLSLSSIYTSTHSTLPSMSDLFRETAFGGFLRFVSKGALLQYPEERAGFVVPEQYLPGYTPPIDDAATLVVPGDDLEASKEKASAPPSAAPSVKAGTTIVTCEFLILRSSGCMC